LETETATKIKQDLAKCHEKVYQELANESKERKRRRKSVLKEREEALKEDFKDFEDTKDIKESEDATKDPKDNSAVDIKRPASINRPQKIFTFACSEDEVEMKMEIVRLRLTMMPRRCPGAKESLMVSDPLPWGEDGGGPWTDVIEGL